MGPGAPPIETDEGWLVIFHAVDVDPSRGKNGREEKWTKRYSVGVMLLDLEDPTKVLDVHEQSILAPETEYEISGGFRNNVVFPIRAVLENEEVKIYHDAVDTAICLATANVNELVGLCLKNSRKTYLTWEPTHQRSWLKDSRVQQDRS
nr:hypothetical protein [Thermotoga sp. Ku-13t]